MMYRVVNNLIEQPAHNVTRGHSRRFIQSSSDATRTPFTRMEFPCGTHRRSPLYRGWFLGRVYGWNQQLQQHMKALFYPVFNWAATQFSACLTCDNALLKKQSGTWLEELKEGVNWKNIALLEIYHACLMTFKIQNVLERKRKRGVLWLSKQLDYI